MEGGSHIRLLRARKIMEKYHGDITVERMMEMLSDHTDYPDSICAHPCQFMPVGGTLSAIIMVPEDKVAYITHGNPCEYEFMEYKL
jgi:isopenicillin-N N-acyltransferase-like protein